LTRDRNETIYRITVEDIYLAHESYGGEGELTDAVVERVVRKVGAMNFGDMAETIELFIEEAVEEEKIKPLDMGAILKSGGD